MEKGSRRHSAASVSCSSCPRHHSQHRGPAPRNLSFFLYLLIHPLTHPSIHPSIIDPTGSYQAPDRYPGYSREQGRCNPHTNGSHCLVAEAGSTWLFILQALSPPPRCFCNEPLFVRMVHPTPHISDEPGLGVALKGTLSCFCSCFIQTILQVRMRVSLSLPATMSGDFHCTWKNSGFPTYSGFCPSNLAF